MRQYIKFTAVMYVDTDGLNWGQAAEQVRGGLKYGDRHQDFSLQLAKVTEIGITEVEE